MLLLIPFFTVISSHREYQLVVRCDDAWLGISRVLKCWIFGRCFLASCDTFDSKTEQAVAIRSIHIQKGTVMRTSQLALSYERNNGSLHQKDSFITPFLLYVSSVNGTSLAIKYMCHVRGCSLSWCVCKGRTSHLKQSFLGGFCRFINIMFCGGICPQLKGG